MEADLQLIHGIDYRDRFRPGGGPSQLTIRRLLVLVKYLPAQSNFYAACEKRAPVSLGDSAVMDVWESLTGKKHPGRAGEEEMRNRAAERAERARLIARRRNAARAHNARYLAARRNR